MNELRTLDPFALDPFDDALRGFMRPWRLEVPEVAPRIKIDVSEQDGSYAVKAEIRGVNKEGIDVRVDGIKLPSGGMVSIVPVRRASASSFWTMA